jgi:general stress protein YciG
MSVREAGRRGGQSTRQGVLDGSLPKDFYQRIGQRGGEAGGERGGAATKAKVDRGELPKDHYQQIGRMGGQRVKELIARGRSGYTLNPDGSSPSPGSEPGAAPANPRWT